MKVGRNPLKNILSETEKINIISENMDNVRFFDEKKFMWDGRTYISESEAINKKAEYEKDNFETRMIQEEEEYFLFTKRVVTEIEIEKQ
jgi:hypothetical protein